MRISILQYDADNHTNHKFVGITVMWHDVLEKLLIEACIHEPQTISNPKKKFLRLSFSVLNLHCLSKSSPSLLLLHLQKLSLHGLKNYAQLPLQMMGNSDRPVSQLHLLKWESCHTPFITGHG